LRVLLVEDDAVARTLFEEVLRQRGFEVDAFEDADTAWISWQRHRHRLVLLDWLLAGTDGLTFARRIRQDPSGDETVIVVVTGRNRPEDLEQVLESGADDYIAKPVDLALLGIRLSIAERRVQLAQERARFLRQLVHDALHDGLTGLPNRQLLVERLRSCIARGDRRPDHRYALLFLDLDRFKLLNDSQGHVAGDRLLRDFARRLRACVRPADLVARLGGDEFTVLLEDIEDVHDATRVAARIHEQLAEPFLIGGQEVFSTASIGIAIGTTNYTLPEEILRDADNAMYRAKAEGPGGQAIFDQGMHNRVVHRLQLETRMRQGLAGGEFEVWYQPIVRLSDAQIVGVEALLRWPREERPWISPAEFVPIAEETGLINELGEFVLRRACADTASWRTLDPNLRVSVNVSGRQLLSPDLANVARDALSTHKLPADNLVLEITENVFIENAEPPLQMLRRLKELGVGLRMDDFGTGYSSLAYLRRLPIDGLKIDQSFIASLEKSPGDAAMVRGILELADSVGLEAVVEGVERNEQRRLLRGMPCEFAQGYLFARPMPATAVRDALHAGDAGQTGRLPKEPTTS
jgi:diguanylate cyclase (GGDEF)-like protein